MNPYNWGRYGPILENGDNTVRASRRERREAFAQRFEDPLCQAEFGFTFPVALFVRLLTLLSENQKLVLARKLRDTGATQLDRVEDTIQAVRLILGNPSHSGHFPALRDDLAGLRDFHAQFGRHGQEAAAGAGDDVSEMGDASQSRPVTPPLPPLPPPDELFINPSSPNVAEDLAKAAEDLAARLAAMPGKPGKK